MRFISIVESGSREIEDLVSFVLKESWARAGKREKSRHSHFEEENEEEKFRKFASSIILFKWEIFLARESVFSQFMKWSDWEKEERGEIYQSD